MREALWIFRKDVRHLWPRILLADLCIATMALSDAILPRHMGMDVLPTLGATFSFVAVAYLIVSLFHEEKAVGDDRYWLTRPFPRRSILAAKFLFILLFIYGPTAIGQTVALAVNGYPPGYYWGPRAADVLFGVLATAVATAAMAAVTSGMVQFIWATLLWTIGWLGTMIAAHPVDNTDWPGLEWLRADLMAALLLILGAVVVWLMFTRRRRMPAICIVGASAILLVVVRGVAPWYLAFAIQEHSSQRVDANVQVTFNPSGGQLKGATTAFWPNDGAIGIYLPVELTGVPEGVQIVSNRVALTIDGPGGRWRSGWERIGQLVPINSVINDPYHPRISNGPHWLYFNVDAEAFERLSRQNAHMRAQFTFTLFDRPRVVRMTNTDRGRFIPGDGFCAVLFRHGSLVPSCIAPLEPPPAADIRWRQSPDDPVETRVEVASFSSASFSGGIWQAGGSSVGFRVPWYPQEVYLEVRRPIAWFERTLDIPAIKLADHH